MEIWKTMSNLHALLREGAKLVETAADCFGEFAVSMLRSDGKVAPAATSAQRESLREDIDYVPTPIDPIVKRSGLTATTVSSMLIKVGTARVGSMWCWRVSPCSKTAPAKIRRTHGSVITVHRAVLSVLLTTGDSVGGISTHLIVVESSD